MPVPAPPRPAPPRTAPPKSAPTTPLRRRRSPGVRANDIARLAVHRWSGDDADWPAVRDRYLTRYPGEAERLARLRLRRVLRETPLDAPDLRQD